MGTREEKNPSAVESGEATEAARGPLNVTGAQLAEQIYPELRSLAASLMRGESPGHTLQPTALAHEALLRLFVQHRARYAGRTHFLAVAASVVRRVLVDHARTRGRMKRGGDHHRVALDDAADLALSREVTVLELHDALERLALLSPRQAEVVQLRFFGGMTPQEVAEFLGVSLRTVEGDWAMAKAWLRIELLDVRDGARETGGPA